MLQVALGSDESTARFRHLLAVDGEEAVREHLGRRAVAGVLQGCRPEQGVEIEDVLANEMVELGLAAGLPVFVEVQPGLAGEVLETGHVADRRIEPDIEILARRIRNLEAEIRRIARDIPVRQTGCEPFAHLVGGFGLQRAGTCPALEEFLALGQLEEVMLGLLAHRRCAGNRGEWIDEFGRVVGRAADFAGIAVLVLGVTLRALALDEPVR